MKLARFEFNFFGVNTYVAWCSDTHEAAIIDPGMMSASEQQRLDEYIRSNDLKITHLLNTHLHIDHALGNGYISDRYSVDTEAHTADAGLGASIAEQAAMFRLPIATPAPVTISTPLSDNDRITLGNEYFDVIHIPGHTQGSVAFYNPTDGFLMSGDALFHESIGRTDLPGGNHTQLLKSINTRLLTLPPQTIVYPGHGPETTVEHETKYNPWLKKH